MWLGWWSLFFGGTVAWFLAAWYLVERPITHLGRISRRLCVANAIGWLILLPLSDRGHPPPYVFPVFGFWLLNFILLPAIAVVLWMCRRDQQERRSFLVLSLAYVVLNIIVLYIFPVVRLALSEYHR